MEKTNLKFGALGLKSFTGPKWARTRVVTLWNSGKSQKNHSYDYTKKFEFGMEFKVKSNLLGLEKLIENVICKRDPNSYRVINVFLNTSFNTCTETGDFGYHILTVVRGRFTWKNPVYYLSSDPQMYDLEKMKLYKKLKDEQIFRQKSKMEIEFALKNKNA